MPSHPITLDLIRETGPLIGPSANISGQASGVTFNQILEDFDQEVLGLEDDPFLTGQDSTILDLSGDKVKILRQLSEKIFLLGCQRFLLRRNEMLRDLRETDVKAICEINQDALGYSFSPEETASQLARLSQDSHHFLLAYEDESTHALLGYVHAEVYESLYSKAGFNILALAVSPQAQGQGIGKSLLQGLDQEAIRLNSADHRLGAHAFYEKVGYTCDKVQKRFIRIF